MEVVTLCGDCSCCPVVKVTDEHVEIGEEGNLCVLKLDEWETLKSKIMSGDKEVVINFEELRQRLEKEKERLIKELEQLRASAPASAERREGSPFGKREEEATETFELGIRLALKEHVESLLAEVEHALKKHKRGTYGLCDACGQPIDPARLEALPRANLCLTCKAGQSKGKLPPR